MKIVCATTLAAAEVLALLLLAKLVPAHGFRVDPVFEPLAPVTLTPREPLAAALLHQIAAVPETQIVRPPIVSL